MPNKKRVPVKQKPQAKHITLTYVVVLLLLLIIPLTIILTKSKQDTRSNAQAILPVGQTGNWSMVFNEEFNTSALDSTKWNYGWSGGGVSAPVNSGETTCYDQSLVTVPGDGNLHLGFTTQQSVCNGKTMPNTGSMINSRGKFQYAYGYIEFRAFIPPASNGTIANWPALWSDGQNWPTDGENDTMEGISAQACYHFHSAAGGPGGCAASIFTGWHTFASDWEPGVVTYYYDGVKVGQITTGITAAPQFIIMNNTQGVVGGITSITTPATMLVDYVRVWQNTTSPTPPANITPTYGCVGGTNCVPSVSPSPTTSTASPTIEPTNSVTQAPTATLDPAISPTGGVSVTSAPTPGATQPGTNQGFIGLLLAFLALLLQMIMRLFGR